MGLFNKNQSSAAPATESQLLASKYVSARGNILMVVALTVINIILLVSNSSTYFLFSAFIPYFMADLGMYACGKYPAEYYGEYYNQMEFFPNSAFLILLAIAVAILAFYILCWIFSKKFRVGWLVAALVFFSIDTLVLLLLNGIVVESLIDYAIHGWVIYSFVKGLIAYGKLKKLPAEPQQQEEAVAAQEAEFCEEMDVK